MFRFSAPINTDKHRRLRVPLHRLLFCFFCDCSLLWVSRQDALKQKMARETHNLCSVFVVERGHCFRRVYLSVVCAASRHVVVFKSVFLLLSCEKGEVVLSGVRGLAIRSRQTTVLTFEQGTSRSANKQIVRFGKCFLVMQPYFSTCLFLHSKGVPHSVLERGACVFECTGVHFPKSVVMRLARDDEINSLKLLRHPNVGNYQCVNDAERAGRFGDADVGMHLCVVSSIIQN